MFDVKTALSSSAPSAAFSAAARVGDSLPFPRLQEHVAFVCPLGASPGGVTDTDGDQGALRQLQVLCPGCATCAKMWVWNELPI